MANDQKTTQISATAGGDMAAGVGPGPVNPAALTVEQAARMLGLPEETVRNHLAAGAPTAADGTVNLVHYVAWLNRRVKELDGDGD